MGDSPTTTIYSLVCLSICVGQLDKFLIQNHKNPDHHFKLLITYSLLPLHLHPDHSFTKKERVPALHILIGMVLKQKALVPAGLGTYKFLVRRALNNQVLEYNVSTKRKNKKGSTPSS